LITTEPSGAIALTAALRSKNDNEKKIAVITGKNISDEQFLLLSNSNI